MIIKRIDEGTFDSSPVHSLGSLQPLLIFFLLRNVKLGRKIRAYENLFQWTSLRRAVILKEKEMTIGSRQFYF